MHFYYGVEESYKEITDLVFHHCVKDNLLLLPRGNFAQDKIFGDPKPGVLKHVKFVDTLGKEIKIHSHETFTLNLSTQEFKIETSREPKQYFLAIACIFRNSTFYLKEWIEYHRIMGVERFYLCDHLSVDHPHKILDPYIKEGLIEFEHWEQEFKNDFEKEIHTPFYQYILEKTRNKVHWLALIDVDEFLIPTRKEDTTLRDVFLRHFDKASVCVNWQLYGTSEIFQLPPHRLMIESFTKKAKEDEHLELYVKHVVQPSLIEDIILPHIVKCVPGEVAATTDGVPVSRHLTEKVCIKELRLNHYTTGDEMYFQTYKVPFYRRYISPGPMQDNVCTRHERKEFCDVEDSECVQRFLYSLRDLVLPKVCAILECNEQGLLLQDGFSILPPLLEEFSNIDLYVVGRAECYPILRTCVKSWLEVLHPHSSGGTNVVWWLELQEFFEYQENKDLFIEKRILQPRKRILGKSYDIVRTYFST